MSSEIRDNTTLHRFEIDVEGQLAVVAYKLSDNVITLIHTEVPLVLRGRGIASKLVRAVLVIARARGLKVVAKCPFVGAYIARHPEFADLLL